MPRNTPKWSKSEYFAHRFIQYGFYTRETVYKQRAKKKIKSQTGMMMRCVSKNSVSDHVLVLVFSDAYNVVDDTFPSRADDEDGLGRFIHPRNLLRARYCHQVCRYTQSSSLVLHFR